MRQTFSKLVLTCLMLLIFISISNGQITVNPGANTLSAAIAAAAAGDILVLNGGEYTESDSIIIDKNLTIKAAAGLTEKPVLKTASATFMVLKSDLILEGLDFDGQANIGTNTTAVIYNDPPDNNDLTITNCIFHDFGGTGATIIESGGDVIGFNSLLIDDCIFENIGGSENRGRSIYLSSRDNLNAGCKKTKITNSTFAHNSRENILLQGYPPANTTDSATVEFDHLTFYGSANGIKLENIYGSIFNCILAKLGDDGVIAQGKTIISVDYSDFFDIREVIFEVRDDSKVNVGSNIFEINPQFIDPANGDYTLNASSPLLTAGSDGGSIGDPRWDLSKAGKFGLTTTVIGHGSINFDSFSGWYDSATNATVTANPASGWVFDSWSGDASGSENPLTVTMDGDKNIIAIFSAGPNVIYYTGFESGVLDTIAWTTKTSAAEGRIQVTTDYGPHSGNYHLTMDTEVTTPSKVTNEAWLHLDLSGKSQVNLNFWWHDYNDANDEFVDGIFFSDDGGVTFEQVLSLIDGTLEYQEINLDVDSLASANSLNLTNEFIIKFQQSEDHPIPLNDGFGFDDINVIAETLDDIAENKTGEKVRQYVLHQNYPNPFNPVTNIKFELPENGMVKLNIYNILGQKVLELVNRELNSGKYSYSFDAGNLPSGVYVYKLETKNYNQTRKMILMK